MTLVLVLVSDNSGDCQCTETNKREPQLFYDCKSARGGVSTL